MDFTSTMKASSFMRSTTLSISRTACASSALPSMKDSRARRTMSGNRRSHARNINGKIGLGQVHHVHHTLGNIHCLVAYPLEVSIDLGDCENEAQVHRHRLLHGQQVERAFVDFALSDVDLGFAFEHHAAARQVALI